jgi:hypothetical protein
MSYTQKGNLILEQIDALVAQDGRQPLPSEIFAPLASDFTPDSAVMKKLKIAQRKLDAAKAMADTCTPTALAALRSKRFHEIIQQTISGELKPGNGELSISAMQEDFLERRKAIVEGIRQLCVEATPSTKAILEAFKRNVEQDLANFTASHLGECQRTGFSLKESAGMVHARKALAMLSAKISAPFLGEPRQILAGIVTL